MHSYKDINKRWEAEGSANTALPVGDADMPDILRTTTVVGEVELKSTKLELGIAEDGYPHSLDGMRKLYADAARSRRMCMSEGRSHSSIAILECQKCGHTSSKECAEKPEHEYRAYLANRMPPHTFAARLARTVPMQLRLEGLGAMVDASKPDNVDASLWTEWLERVAAVGNAEFRFAEATRGEFWKIVYSDTTAELTLELLLHTSGDAPPSAHWHVYAEPPAERGALRSWLEAPLLRATVAASATSVLDASWSLRLPANNELEATITGTGELVPSFEAQFGIEKFADAQRWSSWDVSVAAAHSSKLETDVSGRYELLDKCFASLGSLHKRSGTAEPMYLFMDAQRVGAPEKDSFVFARDWRRLGFGEVRASAVCRLDKKFRAQVRSCLVSSLRTVGGHCHRLVKQNAVPSNIHAMVILCDMSQSLTYYRTWLLYLAVVPGCCSGACI